MRNTAHNRKTLMRKMQHEMRNASDPKKAGSKFIEDFERQYPSSTLIDDLFASYESFLLGCELRPEKKTARFWWLPPTFVGATSLLIWASLYSTSYWKLLLGIGVTLILIAVGLSWRLHFRHRYKTSMIGAGLGLVSKPIVTTSLGLNLIQKYAGVENAIQADASIGGPSAGTESDAVVLVSCLICGTLLIVLGAFKAPEAE